MSLHLRPGKHTSSPRFYAKFPPGILRGVEVCGSPLEARGTDEDPQLALLGALQRDVTSAKPQTYRPIQLASLVHAEVES